MQRLRSVKILNCFLGDARKSQRCFGQAASQTHPHLIKEGEVTPGLSKSEFHQRRRRLMEMISHHQAKKRSSMTTNDHIVIIPAAPKTYMSHDIPYPFRQNTDFLYLSGFLEPDSLLVLDGKLNSLPDYSATLFVPKKDPYRELWDGPRSGIDGSIHLTGVDFAFNLEELGDYLRRYRKNHDNFTIWYDFRKPAHMEYHNREISDFLKTNTFGGLENPRTLIQALRLLKSPAEQKLMQKTCDIASKAFIDVMRFSHPGVNESQLYARMDYESRMLGADILAYPPVVAGGSRANIIHYISNNQIINEGDMVLMDAGCECHGYTSDITRTWPVSGKMSAAQSDLYEAVLEVQEDCIRISGKADMTLEEIFLHMLTKLGQQLQKLGIISASKQGTDLQRITREFCPHHVGHYLGMDVHDTDEIPRSFKLQPGMCITIEPGVYIPSSQLEVPKHFRGVGIRIEDDILITEYDPIVLTAKCPKHPGDIAAVMNKS